MSMCHQQEIACLLVFASGTGALLLSNMTEQQQLEHIVKGLTRIYPDCAEEVMQPIKMIFKEWSKDPFARWVLVAAAMLAAVHHVVFLPVAAQCRPRRRAS